MTRIAICAATAATMITITGACAREDQPSRASPQNVSQQEREPRPPSSDRVPVAMRPANACGWIPVHEVEAIVGKLAEPPRRGEGGCIYTLTIPPNVVAERAKLDRVREAIAKMPGAEKTPKGDVPPYAFVLEVSVTDDASAERIGKMTGEILASWLKEEKTDTTHAAEPQSSTKDSARTAPDGWDAPGMPIGGRIGTLRVSISKLAPDLDVPRERLAEVAVRVRDRTQDLPFPMDADYSAPPGRDPCTLLTHGEAEAVLGKLIVPPYRTANGGPLAYANGTSCAYYTARHHVLILTPHWSNGRMQLKATNAVGGLIGQVANDREAASADTIEGPWDQAAIEPDGRLELLKGDRALEIAYRVSSTNTAGALRLAKSALARLAEAKP
jgi:hypothetical protein